MPNIKKTKVSTNQNITPKIGTKSSRSKNLDNANTGMLKNLFDFVRNPVSLFVQKVGENEKRDENVFKKTTKKTKVEAKNGWQTIWEVASLIAWSVIFGQLVYVSISLIFNQFGIDINQYYILDDSLLEIPALSYFLTVAVLVPLVEESSYRQLFSPKKFDFLIGSFLFLTFLLGMLLNLINSGGGLGIEINLSILIVFGLFLVLFLWYLNEFNQAKLNQILIQNFNWMFWLSTTLFAFFHIFNFQNLGWILILTPIIVLPQFFLGIIFGYARIKYSLTVAWIVHGVYNLIVIWPSLILQSSSTDLQGILLSAFSWSEIIDRTNPWEKLYLLVSYGVLIGIYFLVFFNLFYTFFTFILEKFLASKVLRKKFNAVIKRIGA